MTTAAPAVRTTRQGQATSQNDTAPHLTGWPDWPGLDAANHSGRPARSELPWPSFLGSISQHLGFVLGAAQRTRRAQLLLAARAHIVASEQGQARALAVVARHYGIGGAPTNEVADRLPLLGTLFR